jgi:hypothetical protein
VKLEINGYFNYIGIKVETDFNIEEAKENISTASACFLTALSTIDQCYPELQNPALKRVNKYGAEPSKTDNEALNELYPTGVEPIKTEDLQ